MTAQGQAPRIPPAADVRARLEALVRRWQTERYEATPSDRAYRAAASVLTYFDPDRLRPFGGKADSAARDRLLENCKQVRDAAGAPRWMLDEVARREALARMSGVTDLRRALQANPDRSEDTLQRMIVEFIEGTAPALAKQSREELLATRQVARWFVGSISALPSPEEVEACIERDELLAPFRHLLRSGFVGRHQDLLALHDFVGVLPTDSVLTSLQRGVESALSWERKSPLAVCGPGGIGKSTLIARFLIDHADAGEEHRFPFVYLNFDDPRLCPAEPLSLVVEAIRQIAIQVPGLRPGAVALSAKVSAVIASTTGRESREFASEDREAALRQEALDRFQEFLAAATPPGKPLLLVLDTFEEAQFHGLHMNPSFRSLLEGLQERVPRLRVVIATRLPPIGLGVTVRLLGPLDDESARAYVQTCLEDRKVDRRVVGEIASECSGNPLSIRLAVEVVVKQGAEGIKGMRSFLDMLIPWRSTQIQGRLYARFLHHIHDKDVERLAHPGLLLRRITPEVIRDVMAGPCGVKVPDLERARELWFGLAKEATLVEEIGGALCHRPDVRTAMLSSLREDDPDRAKALHEAAVTFYSDAYEREHSPADRAEEIYHRLCLAQPEEELDRVWIDDALPLLQSAVEEVPEASQVYLRSRLGLEIDAETKKKASLQIWERSATIEARRAIEADRPAAALDVLRERSGRTGEPGAFLLEAEALEALGKSTQAARVLVRGVEGAHRAGQVRGFVLLSLAACRTLERAQKYERALLIADRARSEVGDRAKPIEILELNVSRLRMRRLADLTGDPAIPGIRTESLRLLPRISDNELFLAPRVLKQAAAELGERKDVLERALKLVGLGPLTSREARLLAGALAAWDRTVPPREEGRRRPGEIAQSARVTGMVGWVRALTYRRPKELGLFLWKLLENHGSNRGLAVALVRIYRTSVAPSSRRSRKPGKGTGKEAQA